ncbi:MAG TPA: Uma2 family endonuclease [Abditibacteriaceae bacterium]|jgi:Uma2 family endonuclease
MVAVSTPQISPVPAEEKLLTAEEYYATCRLQHTELINGKVVELSPPGFEHGEIAVKIASRIQAFVRDHKLGRVSVEGGFRLQRNPAIVRSPDVSFVEAARLEGVSTRGFIEGAPTLAVEIVSPGDLWSEVEDKVRLYLDKGSGAVWIVDPQTRTIEVRTTRTAPHVYSVDDTLRGGDILPGFQLPAKDVFDL